MYLPRVTEKGRNVTFNENPKLVGCELGLDVSHNLFVTLHQPETPIKAKTLFECTFILLTKWRNGLFVAN